MLYLLRRLTRIITVAATSSLKVWPGKVHVRFEKSIQSSRSVFVWTFTIPPLWMSCKTRYPGHSSQIAWKMIQIENLDFIAIINNQSACIPSAWWKLGGLVRTEFSAGTAGRRWVSVRNIILTSPKARFHRNQKKGIHANCKCQSTESFFRPFHPHFWRSFCWSHSPLLWAARSLISTRDRPQKCLVLARYLMTGEFLSSLKILYVWFYASFCLVSALSLF